MKISRADLDPIINVHGGSVFFKQWLEKADKRNLLRVIGRFVYFNSVFGGGVSNLAGEIAVRQDLFRDLGETVEAVQDRSIAIAATVFSAAIDEFGDRTTGRFTHRALAQATLKGVAQYLGFKSEEIDEVVKANLATELSVAKVKRGYLLSEDVSEDKIFNGIGFHMGSEILADMEFKTLHEFLKERYPEMIDFMKKNKVNVGASIYPSYAWIQIHTVVEIEHFNFALFSANSALRFYVGPQHKDTVRKLILNGFEDFATVQEYFMRNIGLD